MVTEPCYETQQELTTEIDLLQLRLDCDIWHDPLSCAIGGSISLKDRASVSTTRHHRRYGVLCQDFRYSNKRVDALKETAAKTSLQIPLEETECMNVVTEDSEDRI